MNLYAYVGNDPLNHSDPTGLKCETTDAGGGYKCDYSDAANAASGSTPKPPSPGQAAGAVVGAVAGSAAAAGCDLATVMACTPADAGIIAGGAALGAWVGGKIESGIHGLLNVFSRAGKDNSPKSDLPRDGSGNYLPHPEAEGPHTTLGTRDGSNGPYTQGATFNEKGEFKGRTDVTDHGRADHENPHFHPATGPNSVGPADELP